MKKQLLRGLLSSLLAVGLAGQAIAASTGPLPALPDGWTDGFVMTNGIRMHYWRTGEGSGKPPMVMTHGSSDFGLCWFHLATEFEDDFDIIMPDARGHGFTDRGSPTDPADVQVEDLIGLVRALGLEKPVMMGHSMGSSSLAWLAARYPDVPRAVILEDPGIRPRNWGGSDAEAQYQAHAKILRRNNMPFEQLVEIGMKAHPRWGRSECEIWAMSKHFHHPTTVYRSGGGRPASSELFKSITAPTLILKADDQGELRAQNEAIASNLPNGKIVHIKDAEHNVRRDEKQRLLDVMKPFVEGL